MENSHSWKGADTRGKARPETVDQEVGDSNSPGGTRLFSLRYALALGAVVPKAQWEMPAACLKAVTNGSRLLSCSLKRIDCSPPVRDFDVVAISTGAHHTESHNEQMSCCPRLGLLLLGDRPGLGPRKGRPITDTSSRPTSITGPSGRSISSNGRLGKYRIVPSTASIGSRATPPFANTSWNSAPAADAAGFDT